MTVLLVAMVAMLVMEPHLAAATPSFLGKDEYGPGRHNDGINEEHRNRSSNATASGSIHSGDAGKGSGNGGSNHVGGNVPVGKNLLVAMVILVKTEQMFILEKTEQMLMLVMSVKTEQMLMLVMSVKTERMFMLVKTEQMLILVMLIKTEQLIIKYQIFIQTPIGGSGGSAPGGKAPGVGGSNVGNPCLKLIDDSTADCKKEGGVCGDPQVVGGDGVIFYFYGRKNHDFCLVSDSDLHINAHFIGTRPAGHTHDNTWVQALGFVFGPHTLIIAAKRFVPQWHNQEDHLEFSYNREPLNLTTMSWASPDAAMTLTRIGAANSVLMAIKGKMEVSLTVVPVSKRANLVHKYDIPENVDCFAHFDMQFKFYNLSSSVNGVLGRTYQPGFTNPVNTSVPMPIMDGAAKFESSSLLATDCKSSQYTASAVPAGSETTTFHTECRSSGFPSDVPGGITCHR